MKLNCVVIALPLIFALQGCETLPLPVAASCPKLPDPPAAVAAYATPPNNLIEDSAKLLEDFTAELQSSLNKASGQGI